jgi:hypothetical protein
MINSNRKFLFLSTNINNENVKSVWNVFTIQSTENLCKILKHFKPRYLKFIDGLVAYKFETVGRKPEFEIF